MLPKGLTHIVLKTVSARRVIVTSFVVDLLDIALNVGVALLSGSVVMLAEALQGLADLFASAFLLVGLARSRRPADADSPFGYGKEMYLWTFLAGLFMVTVTAGLTVYFGWQRLQHPQPLAYLPVAYGVLFVGVLTNGYSLSLSWRRLLGRHPLRLLVHAFLVSPLVETKTTFILDLMGTVAALLGLGSLLILGATGQAVLDGVGAILIGLTVALLAIVLLLGVQDLLVGRRAHPTVEERIRAAALSLPGVTHVLDLKTMHIGTERLLINLEVHLAHDLTTQRIERLIDELKRRIKRVVPSATHIQIELETPPGELRRRRL